MADKESFLHRSENVAKLSSLSVALIAIAKGFVGLLSGSIALIAQAFWFRCMHLMKQLNAFFETAVAVPRIRIGKGQTVGTLINE